MRMVLKLGVVMLVVSCGETATPARRPVVPPGWEAIEPGAKIYIRDRLAMPMPFPGPVPSPIVAFLQNNREIPIPAVPPSDLRDHLSLARLLIVAALHYHSVGDADTAWRHLRTASQLVDAMFRRPEPASQGMASFEGCMITGAMRQMPGPPPEWALKWPEVGVVARIRIIAGNTPELSNRLLQFLAHIEGTRLILAARRIKQTTGDWPETAPPIQSPLAQPAWLYARTADGELFITTTTPLTTLDTAITLNLPQRHKEQ
jgi:hypothetical protein